ncbi:MAG TPA: hypothetical protein VHX12_10595, partial [Acidisoma sp.]|nr:hypothetical protein [Acidisoma sp.]
MACLAADLLSAILAQTLVSGTELMLAPNIAATMPITTESLFSVTIILGITIVYLALRGRYTARTPFWAETSQLFSASGWAMGAQFLAGFFSHHIDVALPGLAMLALFPFLAALANALAKNLLVQSGAWRLPIVLVGDGDAGTAVEAALASDPALGYSIVSRVDPQRIVTL